MVSAIVKKKPATTKKPRYSFPMASPIHMDSPILSSMEEKTTGTTTAPAVRAIHRMTSAAPEGAGMEGNGVEHACRTLGFAT